MNSREILAKIKGNPLETTLVVVAVFLAVFTYLRGSAYERKQAELETLSRQGTQANENIRRATNLEEDLQDLISLSEALKKRLFLLPLENVVAMQNTLERKREALQGMAETAGITLTEVLFMPAPSPAPVAASARGARAATAAGPAAPAREYRSHAFRLAVQGDFNDLVAFVYALENGSHFVRFDSFNLQRSPVEGDRTVIAIFHLTFLGIS